MQMGQEDESGKARSWAYTSFNVSEERLAKLRGLTCMLHVCGLEVCPTSGREHFQGVISFAEPRHFGWWRNEGMPELHAKKCIKSEVANVAYCMKDGNIKIKFPEKIIEDYMVKNEASKKRKTRHYEAGEVEKETVFRIRSGDSIKSIHEDHPIYVYRNHRMMRSYCAMLEFWGARENHGADDLVGFNGI